MDIVILYILFSSSISQSTSWLPFFTLLLPYDLVLRFWSTRMSSEFFKGLTTAVIGDYNLDMTTGILVSASISYLRLLEPVSVPVLKSFFRA